MWCPCCQSRSPLVAIQPEGLVCAQCHVEVEFGEPANGAPVQQVALTGPKLQIAEASAELQLGLVEDVRLSTLAEFEVLASSASDGSIGLLAAAACSQSKVDRRDPSNRVRNSGGTKRPAPLTQLPADQPLYRFDAAHPPVGGRTKAAIDQQQARYSTGPQAGTPSAAKPAVNLPSKQVAQIGLVENSRGESASSSFSLQSDSIASSSSALQTSVPFVPKATTERPNGPGPGADAAAAEFAIRRVPKSFLLPRATNRWPGRLCLLSGSLFIAGQCWLLWSFLRGEALGVAGGILVTAASFAMALYIIARYCDEDLEQQ